MANLLTHSLFYDNVIIFIVICWLVELQKVKTCDSNHNIDQGDDGSGGHDDICGGVGCDNSHFYL